MERVVIFVVVLVVYVIYRVIRGSNQEVPAPRLQHTAAPQHTKPAPQGGKSYPFSEFSSDPRFPQIRTIHTKIRGVTKTNADGSDRQRIIRQCCGSGDALFFIREPRNPVDRNAIQARRVVCTDVADKPRLGEQVGYLSRDLAQEFATRIDDEGWILMAEILNVTGGEGGESLGVNVEIAAYMPAPSQPHPKKRRAHRRAKAELPPQS
jgi:hypothetical protein